MFKGIFYEIVYFLIVDEFFIILFFYLCCWICEIQMDREKIVFFVFGECFGIKYDFAETSL